jgi:nucleoside recognition membrane protein YjiH
VNRDTKIALGTLLILIGTIWLFLIIIWMPPLLSFVVLVGQKIGLPDGFYGQWLLWTETVLATFALGSGIYLLIRRGRPISN